MSEASDEFEEAAASQQLHTILPSEDVAGTVTKAEMVAVYDNRMVPEQSPGRFIYDDLKAAPAHGTCPLCGHRVVATLDHHLPKTDYPALAVTPLNLIPACSDCNKAKKANRPACEEELTLHPYFDDIDGETWLGAKVLESAPPGIQYFVNLPDGWSDTLVARVRTHFTAFGIAELYAAQAASEMMSIRRYLTELLKSTGPDGVQQYLVDQAESSAEAADNSWRTAAYRAFSASQWFFSGGFQ